MELTSDGLQRLGELRIEQFRDRTVARSSNTTDRLSNLKNVLRRLAHTHEESDLDARPQVVHADQPVLAVTVDLNTLHGNIHVFGLMKDWQDDHARERHFGSAHAVPDEGLALFHLAVKARDEHRAARKEQNGE